MTIAALGVLLAGCSGSGGENATTAERAPGDRGGMGAPAVPDQRTDTDGRSLQKAPSARDPRYLSTFALDVDTASYGFTRRSLMDGRLPAGRSVRPEEFVNTFRQNYAEPSGDGFAISTDGGRLTGAGTEPADEAGETEGSGETDGSDEAEGSDKAGGDVRLLRVGLQTAGAGDDGTARADANLTFVIDTSGSMREPGRLDLVQDALHTLVDRLRPTDSVAIVAYSSNARLLREMTPVSRKADLHRAIDRLEAGSNTNLESGMTVGYREARRAYRAGATNRVILASDGLANTGSTKSGPILAKVSDEAAKGISLLCVGVGSDYGDTLMEELADHGDGRAVYVSERDRARELFTEQLPATLDLRARDAKAQVEFDGRTVDTFRLVGYDNRGLDADDFRDDSVDGGEIGPGHSVTALYVVRLRPGADGRIAQVRVRWQHPETRAPAEATETVDTGDLAPPLWTAESVPLRVSATAALFAERLRDGAGDGLQEPVSTPKSPYVSPSQGPFVTAGRLPGEPYAGLPELARHARALAEVSEDSDVVELAGLIDRAIRLG